ncbi:LysR family transcriptional regulator [Rhodoblastus sp.]|uniref:LysR family transcriptional regulator n=1 Tax=Rhodoblastus sp. TaxID=1962975 RepID=UPI0026328A7B|nr:LysR family transcriptional regulator [Rhodoblastus sp.]
MDVSLARTFLAVVSTGSFAAAADKLNVTQTAVGARIKALEDQLGRPLFIRNKGGARLSAAGERFLRHATIMVQSWETARQQIKLPPGRAEGVSVGAELSLWEPTVTNWLVWMHSQRPDVAIHVEVDSAPRLLDAVHAGSLDIAVVHNPPQQQDLVVELLYEDKLILVTTAQDGRLHPDDYIRVDWGPAFAVNIRAAASTPIDAPLSVNFGPLARAYMMAVGGAGYFRLRSVQAQLDEGRLRRVAGAPQFSHSIYIVYAARHDRELIDVIRTSLRDSFAGK